MMVWDPTKLAASDAACSGLHNGLSRVSFGSQGAEIWGAQHGNCPFSGRKSTTPDDDLWLRENPRNRGWGYLGTYMGR